MKKRNNFGIMKMSLRAKGEAILKARFLALLGMTQKREVYYENEFVFNIFDFLTTYSYKCLCKNYNQGRLSANP